MSDLSNMRILVVDDIEANIDILVDTLGDDYRISVAMDGESALEDIREVLPDLILLDIMMPGIDGYQVCQHLKSDNTTRNIPIIFLTALTEESNEAKGLALGAVDYITKPFSPELIKSRVRNHLELKHYRNHLEEMLKAVSIILEGKGSHFDPDMVDAFENLSKEFRKIALEFADYDEERKTLWK